MRIVRIVCGLIMTAGLSSCATRPVPVEQPFTQVKLHEICARNDIQWQWDALSQVVTLDHKGIQARAMVDSSVVLLGEERIFLSAPMQRKNGVLMVPPDFERKIILTMPVRFQQAPPSAALHKYREVIIDAGHGGKDPGAISKRGTKEKKVVLDIARRLQKSLQQQGIKVVMTRQDDHFISLPERTAIASRSNADLFISLHANASSNRLIRGIEVYYMTDRGPNDREQQLLDNENTVLQKLKMPENAAVVKDILADMLYANKQGDAPLFADYLTAKMSQLTDAPNRGSRPCRFFVVRNTIIPAILIEVGYLTNSTEEGLLNTADYRQRLADAIAKSIVDYANGS